MFKAKAHRNDDGSYTLSYGKGAKKLTGHLIRHSGGRWYVDGMPGNPANWNGDTKREVVEAWGTWAAASYAGTAPHTPQTDDEGEPEGGVAPPAEDGDELSQWQRDFFDTLSKKHGRLTDWQRAQLRCTLRELLGENDGKTRIRPDAPASRPPNPTRGSEGAGSGEAQGTDGNQDGDGPPASVPSGPGVGGLPKMPPAHRPVLVPPDRPDHS